MTEPKAINVDQELGFDSYADAPLITKTIDVLGLTGIRVVCDVSTFGAVSIATGDAQAVMDFLKSMIHPNDWAAFSAAASSHPALKDPVEGMQNLLKLINKLTEVAGERPTKRSSASPATGSRKTSTQKSGRASSLAQAARSARS